MNQHKLSAVKRLTKPFLFGTVFVGLFTAFYYRHTFFSDVDELRAQEEERNYVKMLEVMERRQKQLEEFEKKKRGSG